MTVRRTIPILMAVLLAVLLTVLSTTSCGFLKRPENRFYSLETIDAPAKLPGNGPTPVGLDGIELPPGLDRRGLVLRGADHRFEVRGTHQWASPLEEMVIHTLAFDLANRLPEGKVILPGQAKPQGAMRSIYVTFEDLAPGPDQIFVLDARWVLADPGRPELTRRERITVPMSSMDSAQIAAAMSTALAQLADRIAAAV